MMRYRQSRNNNRRGARGALLIELLVYVAILAIVAAVVSETFVSLRGVFARARSEHLIAQAAEASLERMLFEIENATEVSVSESVLGSHPGALTLTLREGDSRAFFLENGVLRVRENGVDAGPLTPASAAVDELVFTHYQNTRTDAVRVSLTLSVADGYATTTKTFSAFGVLRNTYE